MPGVYLDANDWKPARAGDSNFFGALPRFRAGFSIKHVLRAKLQGQAARSHLLGFG